MRRVTYVVIILALCGLTISSCKKKGKETKVASAEYAANTSELRKQVKKQIKDKIRRDNVLFLINEVDVFRSKLLLSWLDMQHRLQKNPTMSREEAEAGLEKFREQRMDALERMADARLAMRKYVTAEEWQKLFEFEEEKKKDKDDRAAEETGEKEQEPANPVEESESVDDDPDAEEREE